MTWKCRLVHVLADMETEGIRIDIPALKAFSEELGVDILRLQEEIHKACGVLSTSTARSSLATCCSRR